MLGLCSKCTPHVGTKGHQSHTRLPVPTPQARYDQLVDVERLVGVVSALSTPSLALNDFRPDVVIWPRPRNTTDCYKSEISFGCKYE